MDEDSMIRLCITAFKPEEISAAKNLLFTSVKTTGRNINRKREGKTQREIEDIISLIKQKDPEELPIFVARGLQKLPPVTFDHLDATRILKDLILLKHEIETIKETYTHVDQFSRLQNEVINLQQASMVNYFERDNFVNRKRGTTNRMLDSSELNCESGPSGIIHITQEPVIVNNHSRVIDKEVNQHNQARRSLSLSRSRAPLSGDDLSVAHSPNIARAAVLTEEQTQGTSTSAVTNTSVCIGATNNQLIRAPQTQNALFTQNNDDEWQVVQRKKYRNRFIAGYRPVAPLRLSRGLPNLLRDVHPGLGLVHEDLMQGGMRAPSWRRQPSCWYTRGKRCCGLRHSRYFSNSGCIRKYGRREIGQNLKDLSSTEKDRLIGEIVKPFLNTATKYYRQCARKNKRFKDKHGVFLNKQFIDDIPDEFKRVACSNAVTSDHSMSYKQGLQCRKRIRESLESEPQSKVIKAFASTVSSDNRKITLKSSRFRKKL
ncbi:unnamed protein product [Colias eurytheme]|nr:unnamed protein product [Colias eurytheme]